MVTETLNGQWDNTHRRRFGVENCHEPAKSFWTRLIEPVFVQCPVGMRPRGPEQTLGGHRQKGAENPARGKDRREESLGYKLIDGLSPRSGRSERCRLFAEVEQCHFIGVGEDEVFPSQTVPAALKISYRLPSPFSSLFYCTTTTRIVVRGPALRPHP